MAVAGLPDPRPDHAVAMARFARDCLWATNDLTKRLETQLGPDTGDLCMRIGMHSGDVTAGVLRGQKARFQLFGDTMNTGRYPPLREMYETEIPLSHQHSHNCS